MSWAVGRDVERQRHIGYGVPAKCDHPGCDADIDRGLAYVCGGEPHGGDDGCGLFFCGDHLFPDLCQRCTNDQPPFDPTPDTPEWANHVLTDPSWARWREEEPAWADRMRALLAEVGAS